MRKLIPHFLAALIVLLVALPAFANPPIVIPVETIVKGPDLSQHKLIEVEVPEDQQGLICDVEATAENQDSVHPNSNLTIVSATTVEILDVEREAFTTYPATGQITLNDTVSVFLTLGSDRVFSGGLEVIIECTPTSTTTTDTTTSTTTTMSTSTTTQPTTSTTSSSTTTTTNSTTTTPTSTSLPSSTTTSLLCVDTDGDGIKRWSSDGLVEDGTICEHVNTGVPLAGVAMAGFALLILGGLVMESRYRVE